MGDDVRELIKRERVWERYSPIKEVILTMVGLMILQGD